MFSLFWSDLLHPVRLKMKTLIKVNEVFSRFGQYCYNVKIDPLVLHAHVAETRQFPMDESK